MTIGSDTANVTGNDYLLYHETEELSRYE